MSSFLIGLLTAPDNVRISRSDLGLLTEHLDRLVFDLTTEQIWHLESIRLYNLGLYHSADQGDTDKFYLREVRLLNQARRHMARRHDTNKVLDKLYATVTDPGMLRESPPAILSETNAMDRYFYEHRFRRMADKNILTTARAEHPEWNCDFSIQYMRSRAKQYQKDHNLPPIPSRRHKQTRIEPD
jgi:hypothetical protein